jgi:hypothetical protein
MIHQQGLSLSRWFVIKFSALIRLLSSRVKLSVYKALAMFGEFLSLRLPCYEHRPKEASTKGASKGISEFTTAMKINKLCGNSIKIMFDTFPSNKIFFRSADLFWEMCESSLVQ